MEAERLALKLRIDHIEAMGKLQAAHLGELHGLVTRIEKRIRLLEGALDRGCKGCRLAATDRAMQRKPVASGWPAVERRGD